MWRRRRAPDGATRVAAGPVQAQGDDPPPGRVGPGLPLLVDGMPVGVVQDLSAGGIAFSCARAYMVGERLDLTFGHVTVAGVRVQMRAQATVVRWEAGQDGYVIGARLAAAFAE